MRKWRLIIPLTALAVGLLAGWSWSVYKSHTIEEIFKSAGESGKPVIMTYAFMDRDIWDTRLHDLDGSDFPLISTRVSFRYGNSPFNTPESNRITFLHFGRVSAQGRYWQVGLPDTRPEINPELDYDRFLTSFGPNVGLWTSDGSWQLLADRTPATFLNIVTNEERIVETDNPLPPVDWSNASDHLFQMSISFDAETATFIDLEGYGPGSDGKIWKYDLVSDEWTHFSDGTYIGNMEIGPDGDIIAATLFQNQQVDTVFMDSETADVILIEKNFINPRIGRRWAAGLKWQAQPQTIVVFDMGNDWERYEIPVRDPAPSGNITALRIILYEPPPEGLDGMYEN